MRSDIPAETRPRSHASILPNSVFLRPGTIFCAAAPSIVSTVLGSCVAVCLWDAHLHIAGMNHYVLPHRVDQQRSARFGDVAIDQLLDGMTQLGCRIGDLQAKVYGGAEVLPFGADGDTVGNQNVRLALELMQHHGIPILTRDTGGQTGIMIRLVTETGDVLVRRLAAAGLAQMRYTAEAGIPVCG
jgi:chemotaxis protein CheD